MQQVPFYGPMNRQRTKTDKKPSPDNYLVKTFTEDLKPISQLIDNSKFRKDIRPSHKRTMSDTSPRYSSSSSRFEQLNSPQHSTLSRERPGSPMTDEEMSESEQMIWTIIRQRVSQTDFVVEEREEDEESDSEKRPDKEPLSELQLVLESYLERKAQELQTEGKRRKEIKTQLLALLANAQDEEKLSQRQTPQMSLLLSEALRSSCASNATITGPGGSFHLQDVFSSSSSSDPQDCSSVPPRSNLPSIQSALELLCLPGDLFRKHRQSVLDCLLPSPQHYFILLTNSFPVNQFSAVYALDEDGLKKVTGAVFDPETVSFPQIEAYFAFDPTLIDFREVTEITVADAIRLKPYCRLS